MVRYTLGLLAAVSSAAPAAAQTQLLRYPHAHGDRVVFTHLADLWIAGADGANPRRLTVHTARDVFPRFSPDGRWVAFSSDRDGNLDVYVVAAEGGDARQLTFHSADDQVLDWAPDGAAILFSSNRGDDWQPKLYLVSPESGMERDAGADMGLYAAFSPDGARLAINRKGQSYWRRRYRGSSQTDVTVMDVANRRFTDLTDFNGMDTWPMWGADGFIYFVSDREAGVRNVWRVAERGGAAERVTEFRDGDVYWPALSADRRSVVFERDFGIWRLDLATRRAAPVPVQIKAETQSALVARMTVDSEADDYDLAASGKRIAVSVRGEIFTAPVDEGDLVRLTLGAARDRVPRYSPDGARLAWISDASGREELWVGQADGSGEPRQLTTGDAQQEGFTWSPDGTVLAYVASDNRLRVHDLNGNRSRELARAAWGGLGTPVWSPDGKWVAFGMASHSRTADIYLVPAVGGEARRVTVDAYGESTPRFSPDGKTLYFLRSTGLEAQIGGPPQADIYAVELARQTTDPDDPEAESARRGADRDTAPAPVEIDWPGLERRTRQVTRMPAAVSTFAVTPDGKTLVFVTSEPTGQRTQPVIYTIGVDGETLTRVLAGGAAGGGEDDDVPGPGGGGIADLRLTADGKTVFFRQGSRVFSAPLGGRDAVRKQARFRIAMTVDRKAEWAAMFDDAWRALRHGFYDPAMHGADWAALRERYRPVAQFAGSTEEVINLLNEMIGELNASHSGSAAAPERGRPNVQTPYLGVDLAPDARAGRHRVSYVYAEGPAGMDWVRVAVGDYLIALDGQNVTAADNYWRLLNERLNPRVEVTLSKDPSGRDAWTARIQPVTQGAYRQLRYERWVKERRAMAEEASGGRVGYVHIQGMNQPSLARFQKELRQYRDKEAIIIDQRWNGGGNIEQQLLAVLAVPPYQILVPRGSEESFRPAYGFAGPKVVLQNWRSGSNAEMFPAGFKSLKLGKVLGTPTAGAVIGTGSYRLVDGSTVRMPGSGVYLVDGKRTNMENYGVPPDIMVEPTPEDNLAGRDPVIARAVQELLADLGRPRVTTESGGR
jgi:tricorn protease